MLFASYRNLLRIDIVCVHFYLYHYRIVSAHCHCNPRIHSGTYLRAYFCLGPCSVSGIIAISRAADFTAGPPIVTSMCMSLASFCLLSGALQLLRERSAGKSSGKRAFILLQVPGFQILLCAGLFSVRSA